MSAPKRKRKHRAPKKAKTRRDPEAAPSTPSDEPAPEPGNGVALPPRTLLPHHLKQLQNGSSISTKVIAQRGYWSATDAKELIKFGFAHYQRKVPALVVPVTGVNGEVVTWVLRPDSPRVSKGKLLKYETPKDSRVVIDVPKAILSDIGDPSVRLWITEGSKKADSAVSRGICCIALFGVWNWRGSNEDGGKTVLPDWESVALRERSVVIAFDSDVATNPNVQMALTRLRAFLKSRGARVKVCLLPPGPDGAKTGLDDFFVRGGTVDQLEALVVDDLPKESAALEQRGPYVLKEDGVYLEIVNDAGSVAVLKVTNFVPRITEEIRRDDGVEQTIHFRIEVEIAGQTRTLVVNAEDFREHVWIHGQVGADAIVEVGHSGQRISHMVQTLSRPKRRTVYAHTGWRLVGGKWHFLHVDGALGPLGPLGPLQGTGTDLPEALRNYSLPPAPTGDERTRCVRASLSFLDVAPIRVSAPLLLLAYRAVLGQAGISGFLLGFTGTRKSSTAAVLQQHFGPGFSLTTLPGSWTSTANALEESLFAAKDVLFVLDDFVPPSGLDRGKHDASADRLLRNAANRSGRQRMRPDGTLRPSRPPRALVLATGEVLPRGHSLLARVIVIELSPGDVNLQRLTRLQELGADGSLAKAMSAFLNWLSPQLDEVLAALRTCTARYRAQIPIAKAHGRTVDALAELLFTADLLLDFAQDAGAVDEAKANAIREQALRSLFEVGNEQFAQQVEEDVASAFVRQLKASLASGRAHLASASDGQSPPTGRELACGWRLPQVEVHHLLAASPASWAPSGERIGWIEGDDVFVLPDMAESVALRIARERGEPINVTGKSLRKRLQDAGYLLSAGRGDEAGRLLVRKRIAGGRHDLLHLSADSLLEDGVGPTGPLGPAPGVEAPETTSPTPSAPPPQPLKGPPRPVRKCRSCFSTRYHRWETGPWVCSGCHPPDHGQAFETCILEEASK